MNAHDASLAAACFAENYEDVAPARPGETVRGRAQVRANFEELFASMPDLEANLRNVMHDDKQVWMEWSMQGTRPDGTRMEFVGVNVFDVTDGLLSRGRIYTEIVREAGGVKAQLERMTGGDR